MKEYIKLLRIKHYIKNLLVFVPLFFGEEFFVYKKLVNAFWGMVSFCCVSSSIYIINDIVDKDKDKNHPIKQNRPIANGLIKVKHAVIICVICLGASIIIAFKKRGILLLLFYFILNLLYSFGMKNKPVIDIFILASGFVVRIFYGACLTETPISGWFCLIIMAGSVFMGLGKRRNELRYQERETRDVLKYYTFSFLNNNMYVYVTLVNAFYSLWAMEFSGMKMLGTVPIFMVVMMRYNLDIEKNEDGDPVEVILHDKTIILLIIVYVVVVFVLLYII